MKGCLRRLRRLARLPSARLEGGFTLTELLVVVTISSFIVGALASSFIVGARTEADAYNRLQESHDGQLASAYFVADASSTGYFSANIRPPVSKQCPDFGSNGDVALFEWMDAGTSPPTRKDAFYGVTGSPSQLVRRYCEGDVLQSEVTLAKNLSTARAPVVRACPVSRAEGEGDRPECATLPAVLELQVWETSGYTYKLRASPRTQP